MNTQSDSMQPCSRRGFLLGMAGVGAATLPLSWLARAAAAPRPNIVILLSDDMGWDQVGFNGSKEVPTPNVDAIARRRQADAVLWAARLLALAELHHDGPLRVEDRHGTEAVHRIEA